MCVVVVFVWNVYLLNTFWVLVKSFAFHNFVFTNKNESKTDAEIFNSCVCIFLLVSKIEIHLEGLISTNNENDPLNKVIVSYFDCWNFEIAQSTNFFDFFTLFLYFGGTARIVNFDILKELFREWNRQKSFPN